MADRAFIEPLADVWRALADLCHQLAPEDWDRPTDCPGWSVRDQVSHVIGTESMLLGRAAPPPAPEDLPHVKNRIGEMNEGWIEARRGLDGASVTAELEEVTRTRLEALRAMSDDELDAPTPSPIGMVPYFMFMDVRIMDCWTHEQDIRRAVGRPGHLDSPGAVVALRRMAQTIGFVVGKRVGAPDGTTVVFDLSGPLAQVLAVGVEGGRAAPIDPPADPTVRIVMDTETFVCLAAGRWSGPDVKVAFVGDETLGRTIVDNMATIP